LLRCDRIVLCLRHDLERRDVDLVAAWRARVGAGRAVDDDGALLREMIRAGERLVAHRLLRHDALDEAGAVAQRQEVDLAARPLVVQPSAQADGLALVPCDVFDVSELCHRVVSFRLEGGSYKVSMRSNRPRTACAFFRISAGEPVFASSSRYVPS